MCINRFTVDVLYRQPDTSVHCTVDLTLVREFFLRRSVGLADHYFFLLSFWQVTIHLCLCLILVTSESQQSTSFSFSLCLYNTNGKFIFSFRFLFFSFLFFVIFPVFFVFFFLFFISPFSLFGSSFDCHNISRFKHGTLKAPFFVTL